MNIVYSIRHGRTTGGNNSAEVSAEATLFAQADSLTSLVAFGLRVWKAVGRAWSAVLYAECVAQVQGFSV